MRFDHFADLLTKHRWAVALFIIAMSGVALCGHLFDWTVRGSSENSPRVPSMGDPFQRSPVNCFLVVETDDLFRAESVKALRDVVQSVDELGQVRRIVWIDRMPTLNVFGLSEPLLPSNDASPETFEEARERVLSNPLVIGQLLSEDGKLLLMPITLDWIRVTSNEDCTEAILQAARTAAARWPDVPMQISLTGSVPLYLAHQRAFDRNQFQFQAIGYGAVLVLAIFMFRGVRAVMIVAAAPALGIFWSLGILKLLNELSNPLTNVVLPVLVAMIGLTDGVHLMVHIRRERAAGRSPIEASRSALRQVGLACALTSLTTAIGFGSLMLANSEFVQDFGRGCALGVLITFLAVVSFIPLICSTTGRSRDSSRTRA